MSRSSVTARHDLWGRSLNRNPENFGITPSTRNRESHLE
jgi:hypothetical protein